MQRPRRSTAGASVAARALWLLPLDCISDTSGKQSCGKRP